MLAGVVALKNQPAKLTPEEEFRAAAHRLVDSFDVDAWVKRYEEAINTDKVVDFSELNKSLREKFGWPASGSIMGHAEGPEAFFLRERAKRGYPPL